MSLLDKINLYEQELTALSKEETTFKKKYQSLQDSLNHTKSLLEKGDVTSVANATSFNFFQGASTLSYKEVVIVAAKTVYQDIKNDSNESLHNYYSHFVSVFGRKPYDDWKYSGIPYNYARGIAALDILKERLGNDYVLKLQGLRKPETFKEKLKHFLFNVYPPD